MGFNELAQQQVSTNIKLLGGVPATITPTNDLSFTANVIVDKGVTREGGFDSATLEPHTEISVAKSVRATWLRGDEIETADACYTVKRTLDDDGLVVVLHVEQ